MPAIIRPEVVCRFYDSGHCKFGTSCSYNHPTEDCVNCVEKSYCMKRHPKQCRNEILDENGTVVTQCQYAWSCKFKHQKVLAEVNPPVVSGPSVVNGAVNGQENPPEESRSNVVNGEENQPDVSGSNIVREENVPIESGSNVNAHENAPIESGSNIVHGQEIPRNIESRPVVMNVEQNPLLDTDLMRRIEEQKRAIEEKDKIIIDKDRIIGEKDAIINQLNYDLDYYLGLLNGQNYVVVPQNNYGTF